MEIIWIDRVRNEVLHREEEDSNILDTIKGRKANWNGYNVCSNCLLQHVSGGKREGKVDVTVM